VLSERMTKPKPTLCHLIFSNPQLYPLYFWNYNIIGSWNRVLCELYRTLYEVPMERTWTNECNHNKSSKIARF